MSPAFLITVRIHDGRYHGAGDWPPSPARLFQALVAGVGLSGPLGEMESQALMWLEGCDPPVVGAPMMQDGQRVMFYMPNNDLDAVGGDPRRVAEVRTAKKFVRPRTFDASVPFLYAWSLREDSESERQSHAVCALAERLYQFGRGVDMAWAWGEVVDEANLEALLSTYPGMVLRPSHKGGGRTLACPRPGSMASVVARYVAGDHRFSAQGLGKSARQMFSQPPKPRFVQVPYDSPPSRRTYDLRDGTRESNFSSWPLAQASALVRLLRDGAAARLRRALPDQIDHIERGLIGRKADGSDDGPASGRVRIVPLPSIGHQHADRLIRRVLVEVPTDCSLPADDVHWAFSGLDRVDQDTGVVDSIVTPSVDENMLAHYGATDDGRSRVWRTVTPAALPESAKRRRIDPTRVAAEAKDGAERVAEHAGAAAAITQALRHAGLRIGTEAIRVQREPFDARGLRAEAFAPGTRFAKERLWHVEITFSAPVTGPLVIGDGRFLGLGVMAPIVRAQGVHALVIVGGLMATPNAVEVARSLRRAVMSRVQVVLGSRSTLPAYFTGHERDGSPARATHPHLTFAFDPGAARLLIVAPHVVDRRAPTREEVANLALLDVALAGFRDLRAGASGLLALRASSVDADADPLFAASRTWESVTPYQVTRHTKQVGAAEALSADIRAECRRSGLPEPRVTPRDPRGVPGVGLIGGARLIFEVAVQGPIVLGQSRHFGGGLFSGDDAVRGGPWHRE
ncbi:MAG: type I-U CRISPR-associated protein Cas5/Cas6 [Acidobacteria bacterium]|nr:type I-U CRISPR-associated protein Cas5/Cas6 [Acidobacteriota bacterium]